VNVSFVGGVRKQFNTYSLTVYQGEDTNLNDQFWNIISSPRVVHFAWKVLLNRITTYDNLTKGGGRCHKS